MGNKEFSVGVFSFKEGTSLIKFPTMKDVREAFLLYHMNMIPVAITHMPTDINEAKISLGDNGNSMMFCTNNTVLSFNFSSCSNRSFIMLSAGSIGTEVKSEVTP